MKRYKGYIPAIIIGVIVTIGLGLLGFFMWQQQQAQKDITDVQIIMDKVSHHMLLPGGETPALVTVVDKSKLDGNFFKNAQNGDKALIYQKNHEVILYRPGVDRIVDVGQVQIDVPKGGSN